MIDRLTIQAAMHGNIEAQKRVFGSEMFAKPCVDHDISDDEFNRRMIAATNKEKLKQQGV